MVNRTTETACTSFGGSPKHKKASTDCKLKIPWATPLGSDIKEALYQNSKFHHNTKFICLLYRRGDTDSPDSERRIRLVKASSNLSLRFT